MFDLAIVTFCFDILNIVREIIIFHETFFYESA